jgi:transposase
MAVIIGMDPHKRSATIEIVDERAQIRAVGRYETDKAGYGQMLVAGREHPDRTWVVEGCNGIGKHIAHRLVHDGETVVDVPPKLSAQVRVFATGNGRARPTRSMRTRSRWSPFALRGWSALRSTTTWS